LLYELCFARFDAVMGSLARYLVAAGLAGAVAAQYFPPTPEGVTIIKSKHEEGVTISYKEVTFIELNFFC
jgi:hypothetical protein